MPGHEDPHRYFDELTAGYALGALEPGEQSELLPHLSRCLVCQHALAGYTEVTAAVAEIAPPSEPGPELRARILAAAREVRPGEGRGLATDWPVASGGIGGVAADGAGLDAAGRPGGRSVPFPRPDGRRSGTGRRRPGRGLHGSGLGSSRRGGRRWADRRWASVAAAAAAVAIAVGTVGGLLATRPGPAPAPSLSACVRAGQCPQVVLTSAHGQHVAARLVVRGQTVWLLPGSLPPDSTGRQIYVLWQITGAHIPISVGSFDIRRGTNGPVKIGTLAIPYHGTWAFAISLEHGRTIPAKPSQPVALGQVPV